MVLRKLAEQNIEMLGGGGIKAWFMQEALVT